MYNIDSEGYRELIEQRPYCLAACNQLGPLCLAHSMQCYEGSILHVGSHVRLYIWPILVPRIPLHHY